MNIGRTILALLLQDMQHTGVGKTLPEISENTGIEYEQVKKSAWRLHRGKLLVKRHFRIESPPWKIPIYSINPARADRAQELVTREDN